jgi:hypothetical protein
LATRILAGMLLTTAATLCVLSQGVAQQVGPVLRIERDGRVQVGPVKVDPVPPSARVIERVIKGEPVDKAMNSEIKSRVEDAKTLARAPQIQTEIENSFFEQLIVLGVSKDAVGIMQTLQLPEQITRTAPEVLLRILEKPEDIKAKDLLGAPLLASLIQARDFYKDKAKPIPQAVRVLLSKSFSTETLLNARYAVDDFSGNVPAIINKIQETLGNEHAVTIDNIIIFSSTPKDSNVFFWAHEMQHTVQCSKMGMEKFAAEYTVNYKSLEDDANKVAEEAEKKSKEILAFISTLAALK